MALLVGVEPAELEALERGDVYAPPDVVERCATVLGLSTRELLAGEEPTAVALLFRRMSREDGAFVEAVEAGLAESLGRFARTARDIARLRALLGEQPRAEQLAWLDRFGPRALVPRPELYAQAAEMAHEVRSYLGLGAEDEVVSMRALADRLGIITLFVEPDQVDREIDGASVLSPHPAIMVNLVGGGDKYWRTRMTLAHELCHLFFDRAELRADHPRAFFIFSPRGRLRPSHRCPPRWHLFEHFEELEARANAFAGEFLAPASGVRAVIGALDPSSPEAVARLIAHFKIGKETAVNRLTNTFGLAEEQRQRMLAQPLAEAGGGAMHPDSVRPGPHLYDQSLVDLVMRAFAQSKIDAIEARAILHLRLSDPLPRHDAVTPAQRAPLRTPDHPARRAAESHLARRFGLEFSVQHVERTADGWRARVYRQDESGAQIPAGELVLGSDLSIQDDSSVMAALV